MLRRFINNSGRDSWKDSTTHGGAFSFQVVLWMFWTLVAVLVGAVNWHADVIAQRPTNTLGLVIHCLVAGVIGLVVMTMIEIHVEPWRFLDDE